MSSSRKHPLFQRDNQNNHRYNNNNNKTTIIKIIIKLILKGKYALGGKKEHIGNIVVNLH